MTDKLETLAREVRRLNITIEKKNRIIARLEQQVQETIHDRAYNAAVVDAAKALGMKEQTLKTMMETSK
jgi:cell division protein FtsL